MPKFNHSVPEGMAEARTKRDNIDAAWTYLNKHAGIDSSTVDMRSLRRKIDWHIVPLMFCCYTMQFLDKVILNVRYLMSPSPCFNIID